METINAGVETVAAKANNHERRQGQQTCCAAINTARSRFGEADTQKVRNRFFMLIVEGTYIQCGR